MNLQENNEVVQSRRQPPKDYFGLKVIITAIAASLALHFGSLYRVVYYRPISHIPTPGASTVKFQIDPPQTKATKKNEDKTISKAQRITETPLKPTEKPEEPALLGRQNHKALKELRAAAKRPKPPGTDIGNAGQGKLSAETRKAEPKIATKGGATLSGNGRVEVTVGPKAPRNAYEALIPSQSDLKESTAAGYQESFDDPAANGDRVDMNTAEFRYIGYFTMMRKAIELVWNYPYEAVRRGLRGEVGLEFSIAKDGSVSKVRVISSSGHQILDNAIVEAIKLAAPFGPLPPGIDKEKLTITGSFRYILSNYAGAY